MARSSRHIKNLSRTPRAHLADLPDGTPVEIWWRDEARIGQPTWINHRDRWYNRFDAYAHSELTM
jgi:hypothetical protein